MTNRVRSIFLLIVVGCLGLPGGMVAAQASTQPVLAAFPEDTAVQDLPLAIAWGHEYLGDGTSNDSSIPVWSNGGTAINGKEIAAITTGYDHSCAIADGKAYCWGLNADGQLGIGSYGGNYTTAQPVKGLPDVPVTEIEALGWNTCAIAGSLYCWGANEHGQLGNGTLTRANKPGKVLGFPVGAIVTAVSLQDNTCAIASALAYCWGPDLGHVRAVLMATAR